MRGRIKYKNKMKEITEKTKTSFIKVMGGSPINRVLDFLIENKRESWTMIEISKNSNVGYSTLKIILPKMLNEELIIIKKEIGKAKLYTINENNDITIKISELYHAINLREIKKFKKIALVN